MARSNPALAPARLRQLAAGASVKDGVMTVAGTARKALVLVLLAAGSAGYTWWWLAQNPGAPVRPILLAGGLGGFVLALVTIFSPRLAPITAPMYAVVEGLALGVISASMNAAYRGLPVQAVMLTLGVALAMLGLYSVGAVRATERTRRIVTTATLGIAVYYLISLVLGYFGVTAPLVHSSGPAGILFSLFVVGIAAWNLVLDFGMAEAAAAARAPKSAEWYCAFGIVLTLVWLYLELLRLLGKLRR
jgi:uncharacterized YccA/Bax inhibitor family protein